MALAVQAELAARADEADRLRQQQVERARYEAELAQRRFLRVDPDNRLVADVLEAEWNAKLRALAEAQEEVERHRQRCPARPERGASGQPSGRWRADFPRLWRDPRTPDRERKRMVRLLLEDVTLLKGERLVAAGALPGRADRDADAAAAAAGGGSCGRTDPAMVAAIDRLLDEHTDGEVAAQLNAAGRRSCDGKPFHGAVGGRPAPAPPAGGPSSAGCGRVGC